MAMLAEPRRKQKWVLNSRGKAWSEDTSKFGQKMLEKMGWAPGKGLGAKEQGVTDHIHVSYKNDSAGLGFDFSKQDQAWTEHQDSFNNLLQQLQNQDAKEVIKPEKPDVLLSGKSLEVLSKQSRARVHYKKFTRGKDVNKYSQKDLANIFGQKDMVKILPVKEEETKKEEEKEEKDASVPIGTEERISNMVTVYGGSMKDYFKSKLPNFCKSNSNENNNSGYNSEDEDRPHFGFGFSSSKESESTIENSSNSEGISNFAFANPGLDLNSVDNEPSTVCTTDFEVKIKKRKKKISHENGETDKSNQLKDSHSSKKRKTNTVDSYSNEGFVNIALNLESHDKDCNGIEFEVSRATLGLDNDALDITDEKKNKKRVTFNDQVEYSTDVTKKKGKAKLDKFEVDSSKIRKKRKREKMEEKSTEVEGFVNEALEVEVMSDEVIDNELNERKYKKAKRRKERRISELETIPEAPEEDKEVQTTLEIITLDDSIYCDNVSEVETCEQSPKKKKKQKNKKKDKEKEKEDECITLEQFVNESEENIEEKEKKKKKKKEKKEKENSSSKEFNSNVNIEIIEEDVESCEPQKVTTPKKNKKQKNVEKTTWFDKEEIVECMKQEINSAKHENEIISNSLENKTPKKKSKKRNEINNENKVQEKEISDKENELCIQSVTNLYKKERKQKSSTEQIAADGTSQKENLSSKNRNTDENNIEDELVEEQDTYNCETDSPWNQRPRMPKKILKSFFNRNLLVKFPGSNMGNFDGYGYDQE